MNAAIHRRVVLGLASVAVLSLPTLVSNRALDDWPQWRGPNRDGVSAERGLLKDWPAGGPPLAWKTAGAGEGYSSFSTANGRLYTLGARGGTEYVDRVRRGDRQEAVGIRARPALQQRSRRRTPRDADDRGRPALRVRRERRSQRDGCRDRQGPVARQRAEAVRRLEHHVGTERVAAGPERSDSRQRRRAGRVDRRAEERRTAR